MAKQKKDNIERVVKTYSPEEVFEFVREHTTDMETNKDRRKRYPFDGHMIKPYSVRYQTFMSSGTTCVCCGVDGFFFAKERTKYVGKELNTNGSYHLNLYGIDHNGDEVLMTKDHIKAHSLGGSNGVQNMQTMCTTCNGKKGTMTVDEWEVYLKKNPRRKE